MEWSKMDETTKMVLPQMASLLGLATSPKPKWMPNWIWKLKKRREREDAVMKWKPVHYKPTKEQVAMMVAEELRDWAEMIIGFSHIDPEKSAITRKRKGKTRWLQNLKYDPPKTKRISPRREKKVLRQALRETHKTLAAMGMGS